MFTVKVLVTPVRDGDKASGSVHVDRKKGDSWARENSMNFVSGDPSAERTILVENDQRLIIEGSSNTEIVYDRAQGAAVTRERPITVQPTRDPDLSPEKPLADQAAEDFAAAQRKAALDKVREENRKKAEEAAKTAPKPTTTPHPSVQPRPHPVAPPTLPKTPESSK